MTPRIPRIALFSGNYNYVRDGANRALNMLVGYLMRQGCAVRVYSPTVAEPAFAPTGDLVSLPSVPVPGRPEYRLCLGLGKAAGRDLAAFAPDIVHISAPDPGGHAAVKWGRAHGLPVVASVHTRFETYMRYYGLGVLEPAVVALQRRLYRRCDALLAPSESFADVLRAERMNNDIAIWSRGIDGALFNTGRRDQDWRRGLGIADDEVAIGFLGRLVLEKGLDIFGEALARLRARGVPHRALVIGDGPARAAFEARIPGGVFIGFQRDEALARAVAGMDILLNPSTTESFGNVSLEAMASGVPVVAARATGSASIIADGVNGFLCPPDDADAFADRLAAYIADPALRAAHAAAAQAEASRYEWDPINRAVLATYERLIVARSR